MALEGTGLPSSLVVAGVIEVPTVEVALDSAVGEGMADVKLKAEEEDGEDPKVLAMSGRVEGSSTLTLPVMFNVDVGKSVLLGSEVTEGLGVVTASDTDGTEVSVALPSVGAAMDEVITSVEVMTTMLGLARPVVLELKVLVELREVETGSSVMLWVLDPEGNKVAEEVMFPVAT